MLFFKPILAILAGFCTIASSVASSSQTAVIGDSLLADGTIVKILSERSGPTIINKALVGASAHTG